MTYDRSENRISDHKPVHALFKVRVTELDEAAKHGVLLSAMQRWQQHTGRGWDGEGFLLAGERAREIVTPSYLTIPPCSALVPPAQARVSSLYDALLVCHLVTAAMFDNDYM